MFTHTETHTACLNFTPTPREVKRHYFSIEEQPPFELPLFLSQQKLAFLQTWVVSSMPSPGSVSSMMRGTALKEQRRGPVDQAGHIQRDEGQFDNDDKATKQKNGHLRRMKPALLSAELLRWTRARRSSCPLPAQGDAANLSNSTACDSLQAGH